MSDGGQRLDVPDVLRGRAWRKALNGEGRLPSPLFYRKKWIWQVGRG